MKSTDSAYRLAAANLLGELVDLLIGRLRSADGAVAAVGLDGRALPPDPHVIAMATRNLERYLSECVVAMIGDAQPSLASSGVWHARLLLSDEYVQEALLALLAERGREYDKAQFSALELLVRTDCSDARIPAALVERLVRGDSDVDSRVSRVLATANHDLRSDVLPRLLALIPGNVPTAAVDDVRWCLEHAATADVRKVLDRARELEGEWRLSALDACIMAGMDKLSSAEQRDVAEWLQEWWGTEKDAGVRSRLLRLHYELQISWGGAGPLFYYEQARSVEERCAILDALGTSHPEAVDVVRRALGDPSAEVRRRGVWACRGAVLEQVIQPLEELVRTESTPWIRDMATEILALRAARARRAAARHDD